MKSNYALRLGLAYKLYIAFAVTSIVLIWLVIKAIEFTEAKQSVIDIEHRNTLRGYAEEVSGFIKNDDIQGLDNWVDELTKKEQTVVAILKTTPHWLVDGNAKELYNEELEDLTIGRHLDYPIHLNFSYNPVMKVPVPDTKYNLMIKLPQRMRPGVYWHELNTAIRVGFPVLLISFLCVVIYRYIITPLSVMQRATNQISQGNFDVRMDDHMIRRQDELGDLSRSFNSMAKRIGLLVGRQRQLIQDISHELRTPITRIKLILDSEETNPALNRVEQEVNGMQRLLEDTLTLSWLNNENTKLVTETIDLSLLIDTICEDASFEFSRDNIVQDIPDSCVINNSNHRAIGQALENIIRNAMKYTKTDTRIQVSMGTVESPLGQSLVEIKICDWGEGLDSMYLEEIFEPFFRADSARDKTTSGYGLGLALAKRQIEAVRGEIRAFSNHPTGLGFSIILPFN